MFNRPEPYSSVAPPPCQGVRSAVEMRRRRIWAGVTVPSLASNSAAAAATYGAAIDVPGHEPVQTRTAPTRMDLAAPSRGCARLARPGRCAGRCRRKRRADPLHRRRPPRSRRHRQRGMTPGCPLGTRCPFVFEIRDHQVVSNQIDLSIVEAISELGVGHTHR